MICFRKNDLLWIGFCPAHEHSNHLLLIPGTLQQFHFIPVPVCNRGTGHAAFHGCPGHGGRHLRNKPGVKGLGNNIVPSKCKPGLPIGDIYLFGHRLFRQIRKRLDSCHFHFLVDLGGPYIQRPPEYEGEPQNVVYLVGMVGPACSHDHIIPGFDGQLIADLRVRIRHGENNRVFRHGSEHFLAHDVRNR